MNDIGKMIEINKSTKFYTAVIALLPILSIYSSGIPGVNLGELILILFYGYSIIFTKNHQYNNNSISALVLFGWYIAFFTLFAMFFDSTQLSDVIVRTIRILFYLFVIYFLSKKFFSITYASKLIKSVSILATTFIVIQNINYHFFGVITKGYLPFIPLYTSHYETYDYASAYEMMFYRPTSFFLEPAHYSQYVLIGLVVFLFREKFQVKNILISVFLTLGILLSTSGQGLIISFAIWLIYAMELMIGSQKSKKKRLMGMVFPFLAFLTIPFVIKSEVVQNNLSRIFSSGSNTAVSARTEGYVEFFSEDNLYIKFFGAGFGNTPEGVWFSGFSYVLYCLGFVGLIILMVIFIKCYLNAKNKYTKMLIFLSFSLSLSAEIINSYWIVLMFSLFLYSEGLQLNQIYSESRNRFFVTTSKVK